MRAIQSGFRLIAESKHRANGGYSIGFARHPDFEPKNKKAPELIWGFFVLMCVSVLDLNVIRSGLPERT